MTQKHAAVEYTNPSGSQIRAVSQENDFPMPPAEELARLHSFRPDLVDKAIEMMEEEAKSRRSRLGKIDEFIHHQNMLATLGSIILAAIAFGGSIYLGMNGHDAVATALVAGPIATIIVAIMRQ